MMKMPALVVTAFGGPTEIRDWPRPEPTENEVLVEVHYSGVSIGTEMWIATGKRKDYGEPPFINGYQVAGRIVALGAMVTGWQVGDWAAVFCMKGAHCRYVAEHHLACHRLPAESVARAASLFVQPAVAANALNHANVNCGDTVLVTGQGLIGQCLAILARLRGAYVIVSDVADERLAIAREHCADWVIDARQGAVAKQLKERFPNGVDVVIESTGFQSLVDDAMECCAANGRFVFSGWYPGQVAYNFQTAHGKQLRIVHPCFIGPESSRAGIIRLLATGQLPLDKLISHTVPWRKSAAIYNKLFTADRNRYNAIVIDWQN